MMWWCRKYNRPLKDPLLLSYTPDELAYEYFLHIEIQNAAEEQVELETDKIEEDKEKAALAWADEMEEEDEESIDEAQKWMQSIIEQHQNTDTPNFGEDLNIEF